MGSTVHLGPITLPAVISPSDELGDGLQAVGAVLVAAERRPRPLELTLALRGTATDPDPKAVGDRLRRQIIGLLENSRARLEGMWLTFDPDPLMDSYVILGGAKLPIGDTDLVAGDYTLELEDLYRVGKLTSHREARRVDVRNLTDGVTPRDIKRTRYSADFAAVGTDQLVVPLPPSITDVTLGAAAPASSSTVNTRDGASVPLYAPAAMTNGLVYAFERLPAVRGRGDVRVWDATANPTPALTVAGDANPAGVYGWEQVYGPAHPFAGITPVLVLENGATRARALASGVVVLERWTGTQYTEIGRVVPAGGSTMQSAAVVEWTPERAVVRIVSRQALRAELYVILQRGWTGPRVEIYGDNLRVVLNQVSGVLTSAGASSASANPVPITAADPWLMLAGAGATAIELAPLENHAATYKLDALAYGANRGAVELAAIGGHAGALLGLEFTGGGSTANAHALAQRAMRPVRTVPTLMAR